jgi:hypothetical protein
MCWSISRHTEEMRKQYRNEQEFLSHFLHKQGKLDYWPAGWCPSFKYYCIPTWPSNYWKEPVPPAGARIVIFHGEVNPPDALEGRRNKRFRHIEPALGGRGLGRLRPLSAPRRRPPPPAPSHQPREDGQRAGLRVGLAPAAGTGSAPACTGPT